MMLLTASNEAKTSDPRRKASNVDPDAGLHPPFPANERASVRNFSSGSLSMAHSSNARLLAAMHASVGNQAILRTLHHSQPAIQTKLAVNQPGDVYEQEADRVADQVMRMAAPVAVQRKCTACAEDERVQRKCSHCEQEEKPEIHRKESGAGPESAPPIVHDVLGAPGQPLDGDTRAFMEPRFGHDFSHVRVHTDEKAAESAQSVQAHAYAAGRHLVFNKGQYTPGSREGMRLLAHELTHVVQQAPRRMSGAARESSELSDHSPAVNATAGAGTVLRDKQAGAGSAKLSIKTTGTKSADDKLNFPMKTTCSQDLGLHDCSANQFWLWNVEIAGDVTDDAAQWTVSQSSTGRRKGVVKPTAGKDVPFDSKINQPNDNPDPSFVQQKAGEKRLFWLDGPGHAYNLDADKFDSVTQVRNFVSKICSKTDAKTCAELKWFVKIVVQPGQKLDTKASKAGVGTESTDM